jgi:hypothetical protein
MDGSQGGSGGGCGFDWNLMQYGDFVGRTIKTGDPATSLTVLTPKVREGFFWWVTALSISITDPSFSGTNLAKVAAFLIPPGFSDDILKVPFTAFGSGTNASVPTVGVRLTPLAFDGSLGSTEGQHVGVLQLGAVIVPPGWALLGCYDQSVVGTTIVGSNMHLQLQYAELAIGTDLPSL